MIVNFQFWIAKNKANKKHQHDGRTWTYNTYDAFAELFRFWSPKQIRRVLDSLEQSKVIMTGNYGDHWSDQTKWYAFNDESVWLKDFETGGQMQLPKRADDICPNGQLSVAQTVKCTGTDVLPDRKPDEKQQAPLAENPNTNHPSLDATQDYVAKAINPNLEIPYTRQDVNLAFKAFEAGSFNGLWMWGTRPVGDWRSAIENRLGEDRLKQQRCSSNPTRQFKREPFISEIQAQIKSFEYLIAHSIANPDAQAYNRESPLFGEEKEKLRGYRSKVKELNTKLAQTAYANDTNRPTTPAQPRV